MEKKYWNYTYSLLLSIILLLLLGIFINLDGNGNKVKGLPLNGNGSQEEVLLNEKENSESKRPLLYEILNEKENEYPYFHQFIRSREKEFTPKIAIVIDDLGYQTEIAERIINLDFPVTISILPFLPYTHTIARMAKENDVTTLLHLPMEPHDSNVNPGKGAIYSTMNEEEIRNKMIAVFRELPDVDGINNHMGSKVTENDEIMKIVLDEIQKREKYFIDSMTSSDSVGYKLSKKMGIRTSYRSVFLDNEQDMDYIRQQIQLLKKYAYKNGTAIAIGHPYCNTIDILIEAGLELQAEGIKIVKLDEILD